LPVRHTLAYGTITTTTPIITITPETNPGSFATSPPGVGEATWFHPREQK
jgi:hypothetical protein